MTFDITFWHVPTRDRIKVRVVAANRGEATDEARDQIDAIAGTHVVIAIREIP